MQQQAAHWAQLTRQVTSCSIIWQLLSWSRNFLPFMKLEVHYSVQNRPLLLSCGDQQREVAAHVSLTTETDSLLSKNEMPVFCSIEWFVNRK
jgi:hypothetical protein